MIVALLLAASLSGCAHRSPASVAAPIAETGARTLEPAVRAALEAGAAESDVGVRRRALAALVAADPAPAGGTWAPRGRYDPSEYVRRSVIEALTERLAEPETRALLRAIIDDPAADAWTRGAAALVLTRGIAAGTVPAPEADADRTRVAAAAATAKGTRAGPLLLAAARVGDAASRTRLNALLGAGNFPLELWFFVALGESADPTLAAPLVQALDTVEPELRPSVAAALVGLGDAVGGRTLAGALAADEDAAFEALDLLAELPSERALPLLRGPTFAGPVVGEAAAAVRFGHGEGDVRAVLAAFASEDALVREYAAVAIGRRLRSDPALDGAARLRAALRDALPEAGSPLDLALLDALAEAPDAPTRAAVAARLSDESANVRVRAAASLAR